MKRLVRRLYITIIAVMLVFAVVACGDKEAEAKKLEAPANISVYDKTITWDENFKADGFVVEINGKEYEAIDAEFDMGGIEGAKSYNIRVKAISKTFEYIDSDWSEKYVREAMAFSYRETIDGKAYMIELANNVAREYILPSEYNGKQVIGIWDNAFENCDKITEVVMPKGYTSIGIGAFSGCTALKRVTIPQSMQGIAGQAFRDCVSLGSIHIPYNINQVASSAFYGCNSLKEITVEITNQTYRSENNCLIDRQSNTLVCGVAGDIVVPNGVTSIGSNAFRYNKGLVGITIPDSVTQIGNSAFSGCSNLSSVVLPNSVVSLGMSAFEKCTALDDIALSDSLGVIGHNAFINCVSLTHIDFPDSLTQIGRDAFLGTGLKSVEISNGVTQIMSGAFAYCEDLAELTVHKDNPVFTSEQNCILSKQGDVLVLGCKNSLIPKSVTEIGEYAFFGSVWLTELVVPPQITKIGPYAYSDCPNLDRVHVPSTVREVDRMSFATRTSSLSGLHEYTYVKKSVTLAPDTVVVRYNDLQDEILRYGVNPDKSIFLKFWTCNLDYDDDIYPYVTAVDLNNSGSLFYLSDIITVKENFPTRINYDCKGFSLTPDGSVLSTKEESDAIKARVAKGENVNLYPVWVPRAQ